MGDKRISFDVSMCSGNVLHSSKNVRMGQAAEKHENQIARKTRQTRTFEHPVVKNTGLELFELVISELGLEGLL